MRFSDAVRAGAKLKPQNIGGGYTLSNGREASCALRAALDAVGIHTLTPTGRSARVWTELNNLDAICPECPDGDPSARNVIIAFHLNDRHNWTRERIADWYEATFETSDEQIISQTVAAVKMHAAEPELVEA